MLRTEVWSTSVATGVPNHWEIFQTIPSQYFFFYLAWSTSSCRGTIFVQKYPHKYPMLKNTPKNVASLWYLIQTSRQDLTSVMSKVHIEKNLFQCIARKKFCIHMCKIEIRSIKWNMTLWKSGGETQDICIDLGILKDSNSTENNFRLREWKFINTTGFSQ